MHIIISSPFVSPYHFYPSVKGRVSGPNLLFTTLASITLVVYVEDVNPTKIGLFKCSFSYVCQSVHLSVLDFSLA